MGAPKKDDAEILVPDPLVWREFSITDMTLWRWSHDAQLEFPPAVKIRGRNFRSRRLLEEFKAKQFEKAMCDRKKRKTSP